MSEQAVYVQRIDPEHREEYLKAHEDVPEEVAAAMERAGAKSFELYVEGNIAVCILEAESIDDYDAVMAEDPDVEEWERYTAQFKREGVDMDAEEGEQIPYAERIWSLESGSE